MLLNAEDFAKAVALVGDGRCLMLEFFTVFTQRCENMSKDLERLAETREVQDLALRNRASTSVEAKNLLREVRGVDVGVWTVRRRLAETGVKSYISVHGPKLFPHH
ncbi:hypothetical protein QE152_g8721 [Popillia japonica]|uniref:Uncharacterized protein n=1 Tax=Popillia japonica TaxID=7064 RepID=A0AAW1M0N4_POPJA